VGAVIFDLDGVLVDSEPNYFEAERLLLAEHGVEFTEADKRPYIGMSTLAMLEDVVPRYGIGAPVAELLERKNALYLELAARFTVVYEQTSALVRALHGRYPLALASGSSPAVIDVVLAAAGLREYFDVVISAESVERGKPHPDLFLEAARQLGVPPGDCVVVEDSSYGVQAAIAAGMRCIAVPYLVDAPLDEAFSAAHLLVEEGMTRFDADEALAWIESRN
jgi:beta-phosphoglucomutase family hydrolase